MANKIFSKVPVKIPNKSGFDLSHENLFTAKCGTLVPVLCDELLPNDTISLGTSLQVQLPPMASDFYGRVRGKIEAFFVPNRILYGGWQDFMTNPTSNVPSPVSVQAPVLPHFYLFSNVPGSLSDYLGVKSKSISTASIKISNPLPFFAYHKIWEDWYRDSRIQKPAFARPATGVSSVASLPFSSYSSSTQLSGSLYDGVDIVSLRQRNWQRDYFTNATTNPQNGDEAGLEIDSLIDDDNVAHGYFSIAQLRAANSLQQWMERNNIAGNRYADQIKAHFGIYPADAVTDRAIYLGSATIDIYNKSVYQTSAFDTSLESTRSPFNIPGSKYSSPVGVGDSSLVGKFTASEHGFFMVIFSIVPDAIYSTGTRRMFGRSVVGDFAWPMLAGVGDQPIKPYELVNGGVPSPDDDPSSGVFGYTQRYSEYKYMPDEVHGLLRDGSSLANFALQRSFASSPSLGSSFLQIPTSFMDQVTAVSDIMSDFGAWVDMYFKYKKSSTLPAYSIPTLGDMQDTHTEIIDNGGKRL